MSPNNNASIERDNGGHRAAVFVGAISKDRMSAFHPRRTLSRLRLGGGEQVLNGRSRPIADIGVERFDSRETWPGQYLGNKSKTVRHGSAWVGGITAFSQIFGG